MNHFVTSFLVAVLLLASNSVVAFTSPSNVIARQGATLDVAGRPQAFGTTSTTAMNMVKVKVDPKAKSNRTNPAVYKNAAYGGSIAIAVLLPVAFLVWSLLK